MKRFPILLCGLALFAGGCVSVSPEQAMIVRYAQAPRGAVQHALVSEAPKMEWRQMSDTVFEKTVIKKKDPILGLVTISDEPMIAFRLTITMESSGDKTLVRGKPEAVHYTMFKPAPRTLRPGSSDYNQVAALIDRAIAQAQFDAAKSATAL